MSSGVSLNVNTFDAIVLGVVGLSAAVAFFRGFVRELLSLGAWVGAAIITVYLFPHSTEFMKNHIHGGQSGTVAAGAGALGTYVAALIVISIINSIILRYLKTGAEVGLLDNFLGLLFGALRGIFIVSLGYLIMSGTIPKDNPPDWIKGSFTRPYVESTSNLLASAAPQYLHEIEGFVKQEEEKAKEERQNGSQDISSPTSGHNLKQILNQNNTLPQPPYGNDQQR